MGEGNSKIQYEQNNTQRKPNYPRQRTQPQQAKPAYTYDDYADNVKEFSAEDHEFVGSFIEQIVYVQREFQVGDKDLKILIVKKLDGNAKRWFHSKPAHIGMTSSQLLEELRRTYGHTGNYQKLFQTFQNRIWEWRQNETFFDYYQAKLELGAGLNLGESQMVKYMIDGFSNDAWSKQARAMNIHKTSVLLERMQQEIEKSKAAQMSTVPPPVTFTHPPLTYPPPILQPVYVMQVPGQHNFPNQASVNQNQRNLSQVQCFKCQGFGHKIENCPSQNSAPNQSEQKQKKPHVQCLKCKKFGHKIEDCYFNKPNTSQTNEVKDLKANLVDGLKELTDKLETTKVSNQKKPGKPNKNQPGELCKNCYRSGHTTDICQFPAMPKGVCHNCGSADHSRPKCPYLKNKPKDSKDESNNNPDKTADNKPKKQQGPKNKTPQEPTTEKPEQKPQPKKKAPKEQNKNEQEVKEQESAGPKQGKKNKKNPKPDNQGSVEVDLKKDHVLFSVE